LFNALVSPESAAVYRRRRLAALAVLCGAVLFAALAIGGGGGAEEFSAEALLSPDELRRAQLDAEPVELEISVGGGLLIHGPVYERALEAGGGDRYDFAPMFGRIRPYVEEADLALCHVETPMTRNPPASFPVFNTPPDLARGIADAGWDACTTASNHALDQGREGVLATGRALDRAGVLHTGTFASRAEQRQTLIVDAEGVRVALLAYTTDTNGVPLPEPYSVNLADPGRILADVERAVEGGADAVIVSLHWSTNFVPEHQAQPSAEQLDLARVIAAQPGVTAIVGQGPHAVQPIERTRQKYVVFSEGNLVSNQGPAAGLPESSQDGLIALLDLIVDGDGARVEAVRYVPTWVRQPDYVVLPVGPALEAGEADEGSLRDSYERTVSVVGRGPGVAPEPERLP
jgi:poly-gamma-glutamate synthesis protein (capsule biosynthesis protein)